MPQMYDAAVIGAGVVGTLIARELSRYSLRTVLLEQCNDAAQGTTKANSAIVHAGFDAKPGSWKAKMNLRGNELMEALCSILHVPFARVGSLVVGFEEGGQSDFPQLNSLLERGIQNGVPGLRLLSREELLEMEPNVNPQNVGALYAPTGGIVSPYELCIAAAECAVTNGVEFCRNFRCAAIEWNNECFEIASDDGQPATAKIIINAAGLHADDIARLIGDDSFKIHARRGEYLLLDNAQDGVVQHTIFQCPSKMGKGVLITPTVHGNVLIGPSSEDIDDKTDIATTDSGLQGIQQTIARSVPGYRIRDVITSFTGLRAHCNRDDFVLEHSAANPNMIHAGGIESPGLTAAPAIAEYIADLAIKTLGNPAKKPDWIPGREKPVRIKELSTEELRAAIAQNPAYGRIICRCETVSEGEILDAIHAPAGARDIDGVKRRTRAGMGRCQGGFCGAKVLEILATELNQPLEDITKFGGMSNILLTKAK